MSEAGVPVEIIRPGDPVTVARERHKWLITPPLIVLSAAAVLLASIILQHSDTNYQEVFNVALAHNQNVTSIYDLVSPDDPMPLYYLGVHFVGSKIQLTVYDLRLFSLACFALMLPLSYAVATRATRDRRVALLAAALTGLSPFMVWYASRGTMYTLLTLIVLLNIYFFVGILQRHDRSWFGYVLTAVLGLAVHYFFAITLLAQLVFFIIEWQHFSKLSKYLLPLSSALLAAGFGYWVYQSSLHSSVWQQLPYTARPVTTNVFIIYQQFLLGFQAVEVIVVAIALWPLLVILGLLGVQKYIGPSLSVRYFIWAAFVPVVSLFAAGLVLKPLFLSSYFIVCLPPFMLAVAWYLGTFELPVVVLARNLLLITMLAMLFIELFNTHRALGGDYLGAAANMRYQPALSARFSAYDGHQTPAAGPPLHVPSDSPGALIQSR